MISSRVSWNEARPCAALPRTVIWSWIMDSGKECLTAFKPVSMSVSTADGTGVRKIGTG